jgi:hypothetical protein
LIIAQSSSGAAARQIVFNGSESARLAADARGFVAQSSGGITG